MDVFNIHQKVIADYADYTQSFIKISDPRISDKVRTGIEAGLLWPEPLLQLNPSFEPGPEVFLYFKLQKSVNLHGGNDADGKLYLNFDLGKKGKLQINLQARNATLTSDKNVSQIPWSKLDFSCLPTTASDSYELQINFSELGLVEGDKIMLDFSGSDSLKRPVAIVIGAK